MKNKLLTIISDLVEMKTISGNIKEIEKCFDYIDQNLAFFPFVKKVYEKNGVKSIVWLIKDSLKPDIILNAHIDVVPASEEMFKIKKEGDKISGRGVSDMKFAIAVYIVALKEIFKKEGRLPSIGILVTSDEEAGGENGVKYLIDEIGYCPKIVLIPDGGDNLKIVERAKGVLELKIISYGKAAHGSRPWLGESAIDNLCDYIKNIREVFPNPKNEVWKTTVNLGKISGGKAINQVCDLAELIIDVRFTEEYSKEKIIKIIKKLCKGADVEEVTFGSEFSTDRKNPLVKKWEKLLFEIGAKDIYIKEHGASDGRFFSEMKIPSIVSKPIGGNIHSEKEWIDLNSIVDYTKILEKFLGDFS